MSGEKGTRVIERARYRTGVKRAVRKFRAAVEELSKGRGVMKPCYM